MAPLVAQTESDEMIRIEKKLDTLIELLQGTNGIIVRLDRVEQWQKQASWVIGLLASTAIMGGIGFLWALLTHTLQIVP